MRKGGWFRSLYTRIAVGFVALLAALLLAQALLFLWLTGRWDDAPQGRTPQQLADFVARELSDVLSQDPTIDLDAHVKRSFGGIHRPFAVIMHDGRRASNQPGGLPRGFPGPQRGRGRIAGGRGGPGGRPSSAPIVVDGVQVGIVAVPPSPPAWVSFQRFGPTMALAGGALLVIGVAAAALLIFRPTHKRLRSLEAAAVGLGQGRTDVRANDAGGDEVAELARAFNRMADDLQARAHALAEAERARRQLLADVSHELMTPLTAIRGYVQTLAMPEVTVDAEAKARYLRIVDEETHKLEAIIGDLLDLAKLEGGGETAQTAAVAVDDLFRRVIDRHLPEIRRKDITTQVRVDPPTPALIGSPGRLEQAIQNLATNAIRHMPSGGTLTLTAQCDGNRVLISVRDTGPGIPPEHLPHIFERFYKADASRAGTNIPSGSGLGLSIVRAIVQQHGGDIRVANAEGGGAVFTMTCPGVSP